MLFKGRRKDNRGMSLVELLVAIAIAAVISGAIGYFLTYSLRMYKKETVEVSLQQELQTTLNMVMDSAMESQCLILNNTGEAVDSTTGERFGKTNSIVLGKFVNSESGKYKFTGMVFVSSDNVFAGVYNKSMTPANGTLYMRRCVDEEFAGTDIKTAAQAAINGVKGDNTYLLSTSVESFYVYVDNIAPSTDFTPGVLENTDASPAEKQGYSMWREVKNAEQGTYRNIYKNNLTLCVNISFAAPSASGNDYKKVNDKALLRNFVSEGVYLNGVEYLELEKARKVAESDDETLVASTDDYDMEENLLGYVTTGNDPASQFDFNILEILPDERYSSVGYTVAGQEPFSEKELDAMFNSFTGGNNDGRNAYNLYYNTSDMSGICVVDARFDGFFEYVGPGNGFYAIDTDGISNSNDTTYTYKTVDDGNGGTKEIVTNIIMLSKGSFKNSIDNSRFCWNWVESDSYNEGNAVTRQQIEEAMENHSNGFQIWLHDYRKGKVFNNEAFICTALRDVVEEYTADGKGTMDINNGIYNFSATNMSYISYSAKDFRDMVSREYEAGGSIRTENYTAVNRWKSAGYGVSVTSVLAREVTDAMVNRADLIIFAEKSDGAYNWSLQEYGILNTPVTKEETSSFSESNDIGFSQLKEIYYKAAVDNSISLAMPTAANGCQAPAIDLLFKMMYRTMNVSLSVDDVTAERKAADYAREKERTSKGYDSYPDGLGSGVPYSTSVGTGRELYTDFFKSRESECLSSVIYEENPGYIKATEYVYIDDNGYVNVEGVAAGSDKSNATRVSNPYNPGSYITDSYGAAKVPYSTWKNDIPKYLLLTQYQNNTRDMSFRYNYEENGAGYIYGGGFDRESKKRTFKTKTYVYKNGDSETSHSVSVKNGFQIGGIGGSAVYMNTLAYNNDSQLFRYQKNGSLGLIWIRTILANRGGETIVGVIDVKGAGSRTRGVADTTKKYGECKVSYSFMATPGAQGKVIALNEYELEDAKENGLDVYCLLSSEMDMIGASAKLVTNVYNVKNESDKYAGTYLADGRYADGARSYDKYPTEFVYHIPKEYFANFKIPFNDGNNEFVATMTVELADGSKKASGSDTFCIVVRDIFDLD